MIDMLIWPKPILLIADTNDIWYVTFSEHLLYYFRNGSLKALFEMTIVSNYVSQYCVWLALKNGLEQLADADQLPFAIIDLNTTGIAVTGMYQYLFCYVCRYYRVQKATMLCSDLHLPL